MKTTKIIESLTLSEEKDGKEFTINLEIDYSQKNWTITNYKGKQFEFTNTQNHNAGIVIGHLIVQATELAHTKIHKANSDEINN